MSNNSKPQDWRVDDSIIHWELIFEMLSMERAEPFLSEMGLHFLNANIVRSIARQFSEQMEKLQDTRAKISLVEHAFARIAQETDPETAQTLRQWGEEQMSRENQRRLDRWYPLLWWLAGIPGRQAPITFPDLEQSKTEAIIQAVHKRFPADDTLYRRLDMPEELPKSDWEKKLIQRQQDGYDPLITVSTYITDYRTLEVWRFIRSILSEQEMQVLLEWGKNNAPKLGIRQEYIELLF